MAKKNKKKGDVVVEEFESRLLEATDDDALVVMKEVGDKSQALVDAWVRVSNVSAISAVAWAEEAPSLLRKMARRGLNVLRSRGVELPDREKKTQLVVDEPSVEAWFLVPDSSGVGVFTIGARTAGQHYSIADVQVHETAGVVRVNYGVATRSSIRTAFKSIEENRGTMPVAVSPEWARWRVEQAKMCNAVSGVVRPLGLEGCAHLLNPVPESEPTHPIDALGLRVDEEEIASRVAASASLHIEPEFDALMPEQKVVLELIGHLAEVLDRSGKMSEVEQQAVAGQAIDSATDRFFTPEYRVVFAERLRDAAISVYARAGRERALDVLAVVEAVKRAGLITSPPSEVPFLTAFFRKALSYVWSQLEAMQRENARQAAQAQPVRGPLVAPPEALEEAAKTRAGRRDEETGLEDSEQQTESTEASAESSESVSESTEANESAEVSVPAEVSASAEPTESTEAAGPTEASEQASEPSSESTDAS